MCKGSLNNGSVKDNNWLLRNDSVYLKMARTGRNV
jgi:hypothetical protein